MRTVKWFGEGFARLDKEEINLDFRLFAWEIFTGGCVDQMIRGLLQTVIVTCL